MSLFKEMDKLKKTLVEVAKKTTAGRHPQAPAIDASAMTQTKKKPTKPEKHIRADTMTHMDFKMEKAEWEDKIPGGLSDDKTPKDFPQKPLKEGQKVEGEHTSDKKIATEIAMDHLTEDPKYYDKLKTIEKTDKPKRMWKIKIKNRPGWYWMVGMQDLGPNKGNNYLLEDGSAVHQNEVEDVDMAPKPEGTELQKSDDPEQTPRKKNSKAVKDEAASGEYINARNSKFKNVGEDITNSARHKAVAWKGLKQAEVEGVADKLTNLKTLSRHEPANFNIHPDHSNALNVLAAHHALAKLPKAPEVPAAWIKGKNDNDVAMAEFHAPAWGQLPDRKVVRNPETANYTYGDEKLHRHVTVGDLKARSRELYVDFYNHMKNEAESLAHQGIKHTDVINGLNRAANEWLKAKASPRASDEKTLDGQLLHLYHDYVKKAFSPRKSNSINHNMHKFVDAFRTHVHNNHGVMPSPDNPEHQQIMVDAIHNTLKGKGLSDVFGLDKKTKKVFDPRSFYGSELTRQGPDHGLTDDPESHTNSLMQHSKMRGLQYGNSVSDDERKHHLGQAAIAMRDLTHALGLPAEMGSFNGRIGLAFGARGKGRAAAHYEPSLRAINLTRHNGTGSLAHEWGHAFDDILGEVTKGKGVFASERARHGSTHLSYETPEHEKIYKPLKGVMDQLTGDIRRRMTNDFYKHGRDEGISADKMGKYWLSGDEMFARAFEKYLQDKMGEKGHHNSYLANANDHWLMPNKGEREKLKPYFDELFENFRKGPFLKKSLELFKKKDKLEKAFSYKGTIRPEAHDPEGMPHPDKSKPYVKGTTADKSPAWFYHPDVVRRHEQDFMSNYNKFAPKLSKLGQKHMHNLGRSVAADPDRHAIPTESPGGQHLRLRHLNAAMSGKPGYSIEEKDNGLHITVPRHSGRTDKAAETHSWRFDEKGLKFLGKAPISKSKGGSNGQDPRQKLGQPNRGTKEAGIGFSKPGAGRPGSSGASLKKTDTENTEFPQIASVAVIDGDRLLMGKRNDNGKWTLPGGHLKKKEEPMDGAARELKEEANIKPDDLYFMGSKNVVGQDGKNRMIHAFVCFGKYETDTELDPDEEVQNWKWINCKDGLPEDVKKNLHSPKNIVLKYLGLQND